MTSVPDPETQPVYGSEEHLRSSLDWSSATFDLRMRRAFLLTLDLYSLADDPHIVALVAQARIDCGSDGDEGYIIDRAIQLYRDHLMETGG